MEQVWRKRAWVMARVAQSGARHRLGAFWGGEPHAGCAQGEPAERELDLEHLSRQTFGDPELEDELLRLFDDQAAQILARLAAPLMEGDPARRADVAHALKGSALAIGAAATARAAGDYEMALRTDPEAAEGPRAVLARTIQAARRAVAARRRALRE
jgi:HPt (histidine-containing phosphotransfer) domain-containing protein